VLERKTEAGAIHTPGNPTSLLCKHQIGAIQVVVAVVLVIIATGSIHAGVEHGIGAELGSRL